MSELPAPAPNATPAVRAQTDFRLVQLAYGRLPLSLLLTLVVTIVFVGPMWPLFPSRLSMVWVGAILVSIVARYGLWRAYRRAQPGPSAIARWRSHYLVGAAVAGVAWTSGPVMIVMNGAAATTSLLVATLLSVCAVALTTQVAQQGAMQAFIVAALAPFTLAVLLAGGLVNAILALTLSAGLASLIVVGRASSRGLRELIETQAILARTADEASAARSRAESASKAKTRFLANMSHELRTPLNAVIGAAQLLRAERDDPVQQAHLVDAIQRSGANLLGLIENILDLSRIEAGEVALREVDFDLVDCIDAALASAGLAAQAKGLRLACIVSPGLPAWRRGDADRLRQVVMNLLGNAVKFTAQGEVVVRVEQGSAPQCVRVSISDTGVGIGAAALAHVFEPFRQVDEGADRRYGGSGLGLAIVRQLVDAMGGRIDVTSRLGEGSCFEFELPLPQASAALPEPAPLVQDVVLHEPHQASAEALQSQLVRLGCRVQRCDGAMQLRGMLAGMAAAAPAWLMLSAAAPERDAMLDAAAGLIDPARLILINDHNAHDSERARGAVALSRQLVRPVTRAALLCRMTKAGSVEPAVPQAPPNRLAGGAIDAATHVLVVEDDEVNRTIVCHMLRHGGHRVSAAGDGREALRRLAEPERVDLVLMDWQMPGMDGLEVTRRLRAGEAGDRGRAVPIVALTANAFAEDREACLAAGMNDFLTKPVLVTSLMAAVQRWAPGG